MSPGNSRKNVSKISNQVTFEVHEVMESYFKVHYYITRGLYFQNINLFLYLIFNNK